MKFSKYLLNEFCKITTIHQNEIVFLYTYVSLWTFGGNSVLLFWQTCPIRLFTIWNRWKPGRLQYICYKHTEIYAISRPTVTGQGQQTTGYTLIRHRCDCKYSKLALLFNTATNSFQWFCKLRYSKGRKLQLSMWTSWWHICGVGL